MSNDNIYDAVIIGAGIGGLVCGCYLAKAGKKVLIAEQHYKPGGYCTSFKRQEFVFDAAAHSIGGYEYGNLGKILADLRIDDKVIIKRHDPTNIIITPDYKVTFWADINKTIKDLQTAFPDQNKNIESFFHFLISSDSAFSSSMKSWTFQNLLDKYIDDNKVKSVLSFPLISNGGLPPSMMAAFIGIKIFKEFLLGGGYYPEGGMQSLSDALAEKFREHGGELRLSCPIKKIKLKGNGVTGVVAEKDGFIPSKYVISNCDARQTFLKLLGKNKLDKDFLQRIECMTPSLSAFISYLGMDEYPYELPAVGTNLWFLSRYDLDKMYLAAKEGNLNEVGGYLLYIYPDKKRMLAFMNAPFKNKRYWIHNKEKLLETFIKRIETDAIPHLSSHIKYKGASTPYTLYRYTLNYKGAAFGWACTPSQLADPDFRKPSFVQGLYLTGHWTTIGLGIPGVVYVGSETAKMVLRKLERIYK
jgi:phytoene dehydrogenase-like protein